MNRDEDTPPEAMPVHGRAIQVDAVFLAEFRALRREWADALREVKQHLSGIEGQITEGMHTMSKHDTQIMEMLDEVAEMRQEVGAGRPGHSIAVRLTALEADLQERLAESTRRKESMMRQAMTAVVCSIAVGGVGSVFAFLWWLFQAFMRAGAPGINP